MPVPITPADLRHRRCLLRSRRVHALVGAVSSAPPGYSSHHHHPARRRCAVEAGSAATAARRSSAYSAGILGAACPADIGRARGYSRRLRPRSRSAPAPRGTASSTPRAAGLLRADQPAEGQAVAIEALMVGVHPQARLHGVEDVRPIAMKVGMIRGCRRRSAASPAPVLVREVDEALPGAGRKLVEDLPEEPPALAAAVLPRCRMSMAPPPPPARRRSYMLDAVVDDRHTWGRVSPYQ